MFDAIFSRSVKILKIFAKVQCVLAFVLAAMLCGAVHEMLKPFSRFSAIVLGLVVAVVFWVLQMFLHGRCTPSRSWWSTQKPPTRSSAT